MNRLFRLGMPLSEKGRRFVWSDVVCKCLQMDSKLKVNRISFTKTGDGSKEKSEISLERNLPYYIQALREIQLTGECDDLVRWDLVW